MKEVKKIRILIVDDNAAVRDGLCSILNPHADFKIVEKAVDGLDAIAKASSLHPDVILMDVQMPGMDGIEAQQYQDLINYWIYLFYQILDPQTSSREYSPLQHSYPDKA